MGRDNDLIPRFWFCLLFTFPFFVRKIDPMIGWLLATIVLAVGNWSYFKRAWQHKVSIYMLFSVSVGVLYLYSLFEGLFSAAPVQYYGAVASVTVLIHLEQLFEQHVLKKAARGMDRLIEKTPKMARKLFIDGHTEEVALDKIKEGDSVRVTAGELMPVDGVVYSGDCDVDESLITADAKPVHKDLGSSVFAGTKNLQGTCLVRVTRAGNHSIHAQMVEIATAALDAPSLKPQLADKMTFGVIVGAVFFSCIGFFFWSLFSGLASAVVVVSALCIALCPCALVLSSQLIKKIAVGEAVSQGIIMRSIGMLEEVAKCTSLVVNKNGTLTVGKPSIASVDPVAGVATDELLRLAASLEAKSIHPYARCILERAGTLTEALFEVEELQEVSGLGVKGKIDDEECLIGDEKLMQAIDLGYHKVRAEDMRKQGYIVLFCARGGKLAGIIVLSDPIRRGVKESVKEFKRHGFQLFCLSGDRRITVVQLVNALGFDRFQAEAPAEQKIHTVKKLQKEGKMVLMIGDPAKDLPALCQANVGVALGTKGKLHQENAPISLLEGTLASALRLLNLGKATNRIMTQNLVLCALYTAVVLLLALSGALSPNQGAICMLASTVVIGFSSLRLQKSLS